MKILNLKLLNDIHKISLKKFLSLKKVKYTVPSTYVINNLNGDGIIRTFYEKELHKTNQHEFWIEK